MGGNGLLVDMFAVAATACLGLLLSVGVELFLRPRPSLYRPLGAWQAHVGLWCAAYGLLVLLVGRLWCAVAMVTAILVMLTLVNNAKRSSLREPFLFQDYEYFLDALLHPRLFLPFLGLKNFLLAVAGFVLALVGFFQEPESPSRFELGGQLGGAVLILILAALLLWRAARRPVSLCFDPEKDMRRLGLLPSLWAYALAERRLPEAVSPFAHVAHGLRTVQDALPHLVAVQSESFFDPRSLHKGIALDVLRQFDNLRATATSHGMLHVPAWGANTVRTEFAFLTGIDDRHMGVHRFNPYRPVARGWSVWSVPLLLKSIGYRTVCIHPYWSSFYGRNRVLPRLGFDKFIDSRDFAQARRVGAYVADEAVGERITQLLQGERTPTFVFAITMENHGPLHMERVDAVENAEATPLYTFPPPRGCGDLSMYLRHLRNADAMLGAVRALLEDVERPAGLCWYGDHVPIMPSAYGVLGSPNGEVPYVCWRNAYATSLHNEKGRSVGHERRVLPLPAHRLASVWLEDTGIIRVCEVGCKKRTP